MAFDQPLEADRVEDNLLVSLVRGPILGGLMWILGDDEEAKKQQEAELQQGLQDMVLDDEDDVKANAKQQKSLPRLVRSDLSAAMDTSNGEQQQQHSPQQSAFGGIKGTSSTDSIRQKKKMSWSENLVEYMDESIRHEPPSAGSGNSPAMSKPIKSAMTRSTSIRSHSLAGSSAGEEKERKIRYLPNGLDRAHNGLIMPTRPVGMGVGGNDHHHHHHHHGSGIESPQWGWYINTTPPTPEMYHSRSSLKHTEKSDVSTASSSDIQAPSYDKGPNRVFQGLKAGSNRPPVGWPSVPL